MTVRRTYPETSHETAKAFAKKIETVNVAGTEGKWRYVSCTVIVGDMDKTGRCQMCGIKNHRFTHTLFYPIALGRIQGTFENHIFVGVECAAVLIDGNPAIPRLAENETQRKERWRIRYGRTGLCQTTITDLENRGKL